jgi:hypothetical protein
MTGSDLVIDGGVKRRETSLELKRHEKSARGGRHASLAESSIVKYLWKIPLKSRFVSGSVLITAERS